MTTVTLEKRVRVLETEMKFLKSAFARPRVSLAKPKKKLPRWLLASLKNVEDGKVSGPFDTTEELMVHLRK